MCPSRALCLAHLLVDPQVLPRKDFWESSRVLMGLARRTQCSAQSQPGRASCSIPESTGHWGKPESHTPTGTETLLWGRDSILDSSGAAGAGAVQGEGKTKLQPVLGGG